MRAPTFAEYAAAGFGAELLPLIPVGAKLTARSKVGPESLGKIPGTLGPNGWAGFSNWTKQAGTPADITKWDGWRAEHGCGIGLQGRRCPGLDIDVDDPALAEELAAIAQSVLGPAPRRHVLRNGKLTARCLLAYRGDRLPRWSDRFEINGASYLIEFLGDGRHWVAHGGHPKGGEYTWTEEGAPLDWGFEALRPVGVDTLNHLRDELRAAVEKAGGVFTSKNSGAATNSTRKTVDQGLLREPYKGAVAELLAQCDNELDYDPWFDVMVAVKAATDGSEEGFDLFAEWSSKSFKDEPEVTRDKWDSVQPPFRRGWPQLATWARSLGANVPCTDFDPYEPEDETAGAPGAALLREGDAGPVSRMFEEFVWVEKLGRPVEVKTGAIFSDRSFNARNYQVGDPVDTKKCALAVFLRNGSRRRTVVGLTFRPGEGPFVEEKEAQGEDFPPGLYFNTWGGHPDLKKGSVADEQIRPWLDHVEYLVPNAAERAVVYDALAWWAQNPAKKPNWALVIGSDKEGVGKGLFVAPMKAAIGSAYVNEVRAREVVSGFTGWAAGRKLIIVDEMKASHADDDAANKLKMLLAAPPRTMQIERKGKDPYPVPNLLAFIFFTNDRDALKLGNSARRYFVTWCAAEPRADEYYVGLEKWLAEGGDKLVARWLHTRDVCSFNALGRAPASAAREEMRRASRSAVEEWIEDGIAEATGAFQADLQVLEDLRMQCPSARGQVISSHRVGGLLREHGCRQLARLSLGSAPPGIDPPCADLKQAKLYSLRNHEKYAVMTNAGLAAEYWRQRKAAQDATRRPFEPVSFANDAA